MKNHENFQNFHPFGSRLKKTSFARIGPRHCPRTSQDASWTNTRTGRFIIGTHTFITPSNFVINHFPTLAEKLFNSSSVIL